LQRIGAGRQRSQQQQRGEKGQQAQATVLVAGKGWSVEARADVRPQQAPGQPALQAEEHQ
jgi:hypothetical protein